MYNMWATTITKLKFSLTNITAQPHAICSTFQGHNARDHSLATDLKYSITNTASYTAHNKDPRIFIEVFFFSFYNVSDQLTRTSINHTEPISLERF